MTLRARYEKHLKELETKLISMCRNVELAIENTMKALINKDMTLAEEIIINDKTIDKQERELEHDCLKILLLEHPVAGDFKEVSAILKLITDLQRIGNQAADICEHIISFGGENYIKKLEHIPLMGKIAESMVKDSVQAYVLKDIKLAAEVKERDNKVDDLFEIVKGELVHFIKKDSNNANQAITFMMIAKYLEKIADHAVNICEWTEFTIMGKRY